MEDKTEEIQRWRRGEEKDGEEKQVDDSQQRRSIKNGWGAAEWGHHHLFRRWQDPQSQHLHTHTHMRRTSGSALCFWDVCTPRSIYKAASSQEAISADVNGDLTLPTQFAITAGWGWNVEWPVNCLLFRHSASISTGNKLVINAWMNVLQLSVQHFCFQHFHQLRRKEWKLGRLGSGTTLIITHTHTPLILWTEQLLSMYSLPH